MWRAGEPEWRHLFDCPEFKDLFYDPKTTLFHLPDDQGEEEDLSEEAAQFLKRRLTRETHADGPDGRRLKQISEQHGEGDPDYSQQGGEEDYLADEPTRVPNGESEYEATAFFDARGTQDPLGGGDQDGAMAGDPYPVQPHLDPQRLDQFSDQQYAAHPDQPYIDQQYPDQQYLDQQYPADPYAQEPQEQWDQEPEMGQPWAPPEPEPRRKAILPAPTGSPQRGFMGSDENAAGDGFTRPLGPGAQQVAALPGSPSPQSAHGAGSLREEFSTPSPLRARSQPGSGVSGGSRRRCRGRPGDFTRRIVSPRRGWPPPLRWARRERIARFAQPCEERI